MLIVITQAQINGFVAIARTAWGKTMGKYADYKAFGDKAAGNWFNCHYMLGAMIDVICRFKTQITVNEVRAIASWNLAGWNPVGTFNVQLVIGGLIPVTFTIPGQTSKTTALSTLVTVINANAKGYKANYSGGYLSVIAPVGVGADINGSPATLSATSGSIFSPVQTFAAGVTESITPADESCLTYEEIFNMMEFVNKRLDLCYNINQTPELS